MKKIIGLVLTAILLVSCFSLSLAYSETDFTGGTVDFGGKTFVQNLLATVQWIGYAIAVGWLMYLGIKYVMASADEKASLKNGMIKYVIGAILIIGAATIFGWIANSGIV